MHGRLAGSAPAAYGAGPLHVAIGQQQEGQWTAACQSASHSAVQLSAMTVCIRSIMDIGCL